MIQIIKMDYPLKNFWKFPVLIILLSSGLLCSLPQKGRAEEPSTAYQLALIHAQATNRDKVFLNGNVRPKDSTVAEFQWLLDSIKSRCVNSEESIVYALISAWKLVNSRGYDMTLLETLRALTKNAQNKSLFGTNKVDFEKTSGYWTSHFKPGK